MEKPFLEQVTENPNNNEIRLVYADYLEERQDPRADFLKLEIEFHSAPTKTDRDRYREQLVEQKSKLDPSWLLQVERTSVELCAESIKNERPDGSRIRRGIDRFREKSNSISQPANDEIEFQFQCDKNWLELTPTDDEKIRSCAGCKQLVYFSKTIEEAREHAKQDRCVAVCNTATRHSSDLELPYPAYTLLGTVFIPDEESNLTIHSMINLDVGAHKSESARLDDDEGEDGQAPQ